MGEVYRARATKHGRDVARTIIPDVFAGDAERLARFEREARTLAALNHPHIAHLHGVEDSGQTRALVMELVEGEDLAQRITRGPIPIDEALAIARQIAQALEAAHEQGIVHRDLKPANIKVREDGTVKVLDFGLAKALEGAGGAVGAGGASGNELLNSPTITSPAMTMRGMILGTAAYMAPEQAKGKPVDKRADIWAFGCVLYEMITGRRAFAGDDVSDTLASVLRADVEWTGVPPSLVRLLKKCLERDPRKRLHDIGDAWDLIDEAPAVGPVPVSRRHPWLAWSVAAVFAITTAALAWRHFTGTTPEPDVVRFHLQPPPDNQFDIYLAVSPDGRRLAFTARDEKDIVHLWVRDLATPDARKLPDTADAWSPFWSPDSRHLAFAVGQTLKRIDVSGGRAQTLAESPNAVGVGAWNADGVIVFGSRGTGPMRRVSAAGGEPVELTAADTSGSDIQSFPVFLPDGRHFLYFRQTGDADSRGLYLAALDLPPDQQSRARIVETSLGNSYLSFTGATARLLFMRGDTLLSQPFDLDQRQVSGEATPVAEGVGSSGSFGFFSASPTGVLAYRTGMAVGVNSAQLTWVDRQGVPVATIGEPAWYSSAPGSIAIAPDVSRAVATMGLVQQGDLWVVELSRGISTRFTFHPSGDQSPVWSPDGTRIVFRSNRTGAGDLYVKDVNGTSEETQLSRAPEPEQPTDWSPDGRFVLFTRTSPRTSFDVEVLSLAGQSVAPLIQTPFNETAARFSPDGHWIAYASNESGRYEVSLRPFSVTPDGKATVGVTWQVSTNGGSTPRWRRDGQELYYRDPTGALMAVDVTVEGSAVKTSLPKQLFTLPPVANWDVAPDGRRFLIPVFVAPPIADPVTVVLNWSAAQQ
jgi:Tol biopolymer transport system component